jgi:2-phospho-L-lactate guanylyltransferase
MLVIHGDLPQVTARDIDHIANIHHISVAEYHSAITLVPDESGQGSNGLCCTPPTAIPFSYGANSLVKHKYSAITNAISFQICFAESMARDIDLPEDLAQLIVTSQNKSKNCSLTMNYLNNSGIAKRLIPIIQAPVRFVQPELEEYKSARIQLMV